MKTIMFRLTKNWMFWFTIILTVAFVFVYSNHYYNASKDYNDQWKHNISEYKNIDELREQRKGVEAIIETLKASLAESYGYGIEEIQEQIALMEETLVVIDYLINNNIPYVQIVESEMNYTFGRSQREYLWQVVTSAYYLILLVAALLIEQIVCAGRNNGAYVMDYLISGRKKNFISEFVTGYVLTMILLLYAVVMVFVQGRLLADETTYVLYYNKGDIKLIDIDAEYWMLVVAIFITVTFFYMIYFIIAQLVNRSGVHILCAIAATFLWYTFLNSYRTFDCVLALEISWPTVYAHDISLWLYFGMAIVQLALTALGVFATYKWCMKRNIRIKYQ